MHAQEAMHRRVHREQVLWQEFQQVSFEDVINACKAAEIHEVIEQLPEGYQNVAQGR